MARLTKEEKERRNALDLVLLKHCAGCKEDKPLDQFHKDAGKKDGLMVRCKQCRSKKAKKYYQGNREKKLDYQKQWRAANPDKAKDYQKQWNEANPDKVKEYDKARHPKKRDERYGLLEGQYHQMFEDQNHVCAICGGVNKNGKALSVDHDHSCCPGRKSCGKCVRQLLCNGCNTGLGAFKDDPALLKKAIKYIESHSQDRRQ